MGPLRCLASQQRQDLARCRIAEFDRILVQRRQVKGARDWRVVEAHDGKVAWHRQMLPSQLFVHRGRELVGLAHDAGRVLLT